MSSAWELGLQPFGSQLVHLYLAPATLCFLPVPKSAVLSLEEYLALVMGAKGGMLERRYQSASMSATYITFSEAPAGAGGFS